MVLFCLSHFLPSDFQVFINLDEFFQNVTQKDNLHLSCFMFCKETLCMVLCSGSSMCYIPSICQVLDSYPKYSIWVCNYTYTHWQQYTLSWPLSEKVWSQRSKSRCSWVWHPQLRILDGKTSFGSTRGLLSTCSCQPSHFMTKDSGVCLLCWAERTPPRAAWSGSPSWERNIWFASGGM